MSVKESESTVRANHGVNTSLKANGIDFGFDIGVKNDTKCTDNVIQT